MRNGMSFNWDEWTVNLLLGLVAVAPVPHLPLCWSHVGNDVCLGPDVLLRLHYLTL